jgi:hypothetical protein
LEIFNLEVLIQQVTGSQKTTASKGMIDSNRLLLRLLIDRGTPIQHAKKSSYECQMDLSDELRIEHLVNHLEEFLKEQIYKYCNHWDTPCKTYSKK